MRRIGLISFIVSSTLATIAVSQPSGQYELVKLVAERRAFMFDMQDAYLSLLPIRQGKSDDIAAAVQAAQSISENLGMFVELLLPGTGEEQVPYSRAKREIWTEPTEFAAAVDALKSAAMLLSETAHGGDLQAFNEQFDAVAEACVGCHGLKPSSGGRFRAAK